MAPREPLARLLKNIYRTLTDKVFREKIYRTLTDKLFKEKLYRTLTDKLFRGKLYRTITDKLFGETFKEINKYYYSSVNVCNADIRKAKRHNNEP